MIDFSKLTYLVEIYVVTYTFDFYKKPSIF